MGDLDREVQEALEALNNQPDKRDLADLIKRFLSNMLKTGLPPLQAAGIQPSALESYYKKAFQLYNAGQYQEALKIFRIMVMLCPTEHKFSFALGACLHRVEDYAQALGAYQTCSQSDPTDPLPYYHGADCLAKLGYHKAAKESLRIAIDNAKANPKYSALLDRASMALESMNKGSDFHPDLEKGAA
jgi:type III secretion system low calcium response chaperone LcrH/SycD